MRAVPAWRTAEPFRLHAEAFGLGAEVGAILVVLLTIGLPGVEDRLLAGLGAGLLLSQAALRILAGGLTFACDPHFEIVLRGLPAGTSLLRFAGLLGEFLTVSRFGFGARLVESGQARTELLGFSRQRNAGGVEPVDLGQARLEVGSISGLGFGSGLFECCQRGAELTGFGSCSRPIGFEAIALLTDGVELVDDAAEPSGLFVA
jgi:hypothetical protein